MGIPLNTLIDSEENVYQITCIAIKRAEKIIRPVVIDEEGVPHVEEEKEKIISQALCEVLDHKVEYQVEEIE